MVIVSITDAKKRERARLSNLFERLSARLPQSGVSSVSKDINSRKETPLPIRDEFSTVLRNLSVITTSRASEVRHPQTRRNTVALMSYRTFHGSATPSQENDNEGCFPLAEEKKYPFTFKHMIHKLYKKDDWLRTVKEVLEKSKTDFKPLAECALKQTPSECIDPNRSGVKCKDVPPPRAAKVKGRDLRRLSLGARYGAKPPNSPFPPNFPLIEADEPSLGGESIRALKKRCVGIRKSISESLSSDGHQGVPNMKEAGKRGTFVFASSISSTECPGNEIYLHFPSPEVSPSESCFSDAGQDTTAPHSPISPITPTSPISLYTTGTKRRVGMNHQIVMLEVVPPSRLTARNRNRCSSRFASTSTKDLD